MAMELPRLITLSRRRLAAQQAIHSCFLQNLALVATTADLGNNYIENSATQQIGATFNIDGAGIIGGDLTVSGNDIEGSNSAPLLIQADGGDLDLGSNSATINVSGTMSFGGTNSNPDITGTSNSWSVSDAGAATFASIGGSSPGTGAFTTLSSSGGITTTTTSGDVSISDHIITTSSITGTVTVSGDANTPSVLGSDVAGVVTFSTTESTGIGTVTVPFANNYASAPVVVVTPANQYAVGVITQVYVTTSTSGFTINFADGASTTSPANFNYIVVQP
jgi:hypothetical protein